ncbi:MAG: metal transporter [Haloarculaceae archaeon]
MPGSTDEGPATGSTGRPIPEETGGGGPVDEPGRPSSFRDRLTVAGVLWGLLPILLLGGLVGFVLLNPPLAGVQSGEALPQLTVSHVTLPNDETIVLHVTNSGATPVQVQQVLVDEAYWDFQVAGGPRLSPMASTTIEIPYHWTPGWDLETALVVDGGATFHHTIVAPQPTPGFSLDLLYTLALVGVFVGFIPVLLGMLWFPAMQDLSDRWLHAILAFSAGILAFLAVDAGFEAFDVAEAMPGAFEGKLMLVLGAVGTLLLIQALRSRWSDGGEVSPLGLAYVIALGIGLHNLAEGLAIGSSFALGRVSLGAFLIVGFMIHNVTEGPAIVAPIASGERPALAHFVIVGALAGLPVVLGGWLGSLAYSPLLGTLALAIGVGAILQVDWDIVQLIRRNHRLGTALNTGGFLGGLLVMYATDLLVVL